MAWRQLRKISERPDAQEPPAAPLEPARIDGKGQVRDARVPLELACAYDTLRLTAYQTRGRRSRAISISRISQSTVLRFDDVEYFNIVYAVAAEVETHLDVIESRFETSPHGCRLHATGLDDHGGLAHICRQRAWAPEGQCAWLSGSVGEQRLSGPTGLMIHVPTRDQAGLFFRTYLEAFEADTARVPAAIDNMQHLFDEPALHFVLACDQGQPVGVGLLFQDGPRALLCGGAMIPSHRRLGGHEALLSARLGLASRLGCTEVHSWAVAGGQSHVNMTRAGLQTVAVTRTWRWRSQQGV